MVDSPKVAAAKATKAASARLVEMYRNDGWGKLCPAGLPDLGDIHASEETDPPMPVV